MYTTMAIAIAISIVAVSVRQVLPNFYPNAKIKKSHKNAHNVWVLALS